MRDDPGKPLDERLRSGQGRRVESDDQPFASFRNSDAVDGMAHVLRLS
jgi:hypothetical protein